MQTLLAVVASYFLGSIIFSFIVGKLFRGVDVRKHGSGNAGATNTLRVLGIGPAILVLLLDVGKGIAAVSIGWAVGAEGSWTGQWIAVLCGLAVIAGHNWPIFFRFKGGKGIATTIGVVVMLSFWPAFAAGMIAIAAIALTRYVSLGSLLFTLLLPVILLLTNPFTPIWWGSLIICLFAFFRHRTNIAKLIRGQENKIGRGKM